MHRCLSIARPQITNSLSDLVLTSREHRVFVQLLAPPGSEPVRKLSPGPLCVSMQSLSELYCHHGKKWTRTRNMNHLEKVNLRVKWLQGTTMLTCYHRAVPNPHLNPNHIPRLHPGMGQECAHTEQPFCCSCSLKTPKSCPYISTRGQTCISYA